MIPNHYLHFGDFDPAGISIFLNEYWKKLGSKAIFFIPPNIESLVREKGNRTLFDRQRFAFDPEEIEDSGLIQLIEVIKQLQKGLEQELLIE